jgi:hypothetical protein
MQDSLHSLYKTKLTLLATVLLFVGLGLLIFGHWVVHASGWQWLANWPVLDIGSGMFTTGLLGVGLQYLDGEDSEARATARLERVLAASTPAMRDAVIAGFAFEPADLARVATPELLDQIITNGLALRLKDADFAGDLYDDLRDQAVGVPERLTDLRIVIRLSEQAPKARRRQPMYLATVRWESTLIPLFAMRRFSAVGNLREFREIAHDTTANSGWYIGPRTGLDASARDTFELLDFTVDGVSRPIRRSTRQGSQTYTATLDDDTMKRGKPVTLAYTYCTLIAAAEHLIQLRIDQPTKGLSVQLDYSDTDITHVNVLDFMASSERTVVTRSPPGVPERSVAIGFDGWAMPRSGVAFVWPDSDAQGTRGGTSRT